MSAPIPKFPDPVPDGLIAAIEAVTALANKGGVWVADDVPAALAVIAAFDPATYVPPPPPVPPQVSKQFFLLAATELRLLTEEQALAAGKTGDLPAFFEAAIAQVEPAVAFRVRLAWATMYLVERASPVWPIVTALTPITPEQIDDVFRRAWEIEA